MLGEHLGLPIEDPLAATGNSFYSEPRGDLRAAGTARVAESLAVELRPSSSSQRQQEHIKGMCKDFSQTGYGLVADFAPRVGDIYRLEVSGDSSHSIHGTHARCVRCHFLDEDAFEAGFCFLSPVGLQPSSAQIPAANDPLV